MSVDIPITIVGGGAIGWSVAYELSRSTAKEVAVLERNSSVTGENQSSRNSGVVHAGIYYPKDLRPNMARFCVQGNSMLYDFCEEHGVPHKKTGKLVVATNSQEEQYLDDVVERAEENGVPYQILNEEEAKRMEPNVAVTKAVYVPTSGIIEPTQFIRKLSQLATENRKVHLLNGRKVLNINPNRNFFEINQVFSKNEESSKNAASSKNAEETFDTGVVINAAGLYSAEIAGMVNPEFPYEMDPVRGEAVKFYKNRRDDINMNGMNVYPAPYGIDSKGDRLDIPFEEFDARYRAGEISKTLGVHLTPTFDIENGEYVIGNTVTIGPAAVGGVGKEDYSHTRPRAYFLERVEGFFPGLQLDDLEFHQTGIRAKLKGHPDFVIEQDSKHPNLINLVGIDSPGLTASLAIARYVRRELL